MSEYVYLKVEFNRVDAIMDIIFQLKKLKNLCLANNQMETFLLTENVTNLTNLSINYNWITTISSDLLKLKTLTSLSINHTLLTIIPKEIEELRELETLSLSNNSIRNIPPELGKLSKLISLDVSNNMLSSLPSELGNLKNLTILDVKNNPLEIIERDKTDPFYILKDHFENEKLLALPNEIHCIPFVQIYI